MEEDWGAVILDEPLGNETGTIELKCPTNSELYNLKSLDSVRICGYSTPYELLKIYYQYETIGNIASYSNDMINYSLDTQSGQSGAPILNKDNKAIGIHFGFDNYDSLNKAVRMDANMLYYYNLAIENHKES